ncbi:hypothetical protein CK203_114403 [Vitis vinifera]|uniref:Protein SPOROCYTELESS n=1 Tax=Vitis vinifera TaxID=29760 RepID=A0A438FDB6_VITVI|nr:hypothetical protein CK203_114403 [Vitis vinifera]
MATGTSIFLYKYQINSTFLSIQNPQEALATSLLLMASTEPTMPNRSSTSRARKAASAQKKQPQRGMGVAQLERLRVEEWKKMTGITHLQPMSLPGHFRYQIPYQFAEPPPAPASGQVQPGLGSPGWVPRFGGGGFHGFSGGGGFRVVDPYRNDGAVGTLTEASRELSSCQRWIVFLIAVMSALSKTEKTQLRQRVGFVILLQKKRMNADNLGFSGGREKYAETPPINSCDFLGLDMANDENRDLSRRRSPMTATYACYNHSEDAEVVAVHRKGNSVNGRIFMEYEFFPGKGEASTSVVGGGGGGGEASLAIPTAEAATTTSSRNASNVVDLSLKLSY